jgi:hypothetical protein
MIDAPIKRSARREPTKRADNDACAGNRNRCFVALLSSLYRILDHLFIAVLNSERTASLLAVL